jgi:chromosome condensin MukBEF complex kleisin-like MukF subunit
MIIYYSLVLIIKPTRCTNFLKFLFWNETLHVSDNSHVHHQEFFTVNTAMVYVIHVCRQLSSGIRTELQFHLDTAAARKLSTNLYDIYHCCVYSEKLLMMDRGTVQKHVEFHFQTKFEKISASGWFYCKDLSRCTVT